MKGKRIAIIVIVVIILAVIIGLNVKNSGRNVPTVQVEVVSVGPIREIVRADGEIKAEKQVDIGSDIMGRIEKIYVELGDYVNKGDTLCLIDRQSYEVKVKSLEITLDNLKTQLEKVKKDYE
ncbi:MAG: biotin/lipoyl-binding protein, partial [Candidatus Hydrothermia bacterium]